MLNAECWAFSALSAFVIWHSTFLAAATAARSVTWADLPAPVHARLETAGVSSSAFPTLLERLNRTHAQRVREGDLDHLVFYLLQSTHFTARPAIEPALSARAFVDALPSADRAAYLSDGRADLSRVAPDVRARGRDLLRAIDSRDADARIVFFRQLVTSALPRGAAREPALLGEYLRAMRFLYQKEFVAQRAPDAADAVATLYQARGLSTDTAIEAGYTVYLGLGVVKALEPQRRVRRVLIIGPGLDLAPRTGLIDDAPPESYQPWAVIDALVGLGLSRLDDLEVVGADINPRVVNHLRAARTSPPVLRLVTGLGESDAVRFAADYRDYVGGLGRALGTAVAGGKPPSGHLAKTVTVSPKVAAALRAEPLNVVTERLTDGAFDLAIATNILPYFDRTELLLALSNISSMLAPDGVFLHNETRPGFAEDAAAAGLPVEQSRQVIIATVKGAPPLADTISLHRRR